MKQQPTLQRVKQWAQGSNSILSRPMISVSGTYRYQDGHRLVVVKFNMGIILRGLVEVMTANTSTELYGITTDNGKVCLLLQDETT